MLEILVGLVLILLFAVFVVFLYCAKVLSEYEDESTKELQRNIKIKDNYLNTIYCVGFDYEDYNNITLLKEMIRSMVELSEKALNCDDNYVVGTDKKSGKEYNILMEEVQRK